MPKKKRLTLEDCLAKVAECREMAQRVYDPAHRTMLEHMAEVWERIGAELHKSDGGAQAT